MRNLDILAAENGEHIRVLLCGEEQSYVVNCQHFRMPYPVASDLLAELQPIPAETYSVFVLDGLWHYQYTQYATDLTPELENWLYRKTQGIPDILTKLLYNAQKQAILDGREKLDLEVFGSAFLRNLGMVSEYISELSTKPVVKRQSKTTPEVSVGSAAPSKIVGNDIRVLIKKAKKNGESPVSAYAEYIKGEVAI